MGNREREKKMVNLTKVRLFFYKNKLSKILQFVFASLICPHGSRITPLFRTCRSTPGTLTSGTYIYISPRKHVFPLDIHAGRIVLEHNYTRKELTESKLIS